MRNVKHKNWMIELVAVSVLGMASVTMTGQTSNEAGKTGGDKIELSKQIETAEVVALAKGDPEQAAKLVVQMPDNYDRMNAINGVACSWAQNDPESAMKWVTELPIDKDRTLALECIKANEARKADQK